MPAPGQIEEADATGAIADLYADFKATCRASFVPTVLRTLALHPAYLVPAWTALRASLATADAERAAERLRHTAAAALDALPAAPPRRLPAATGAEIRAALETFAYVIPKIFLVVTALGEAWQGRPLGGRPGPAPALARGVPAGMGPIPLLPPEPEDPRIRRIFDEARRILGRPAVPSIYRTLARWPDYLEDVWRSIIDPDRLARLRAAVPGLVDEATRLCHALPAPFALDRASAARTLAPEALAAVETTLATYRRTIPETLLQILALLRDLAGPEALRAPLFPSRD